MGSDNPNELLYMCRMKDIHAQLRIFTLFDGLLASLVNHTTQSYPLLKNHKEDLLQEARLGLLTAVYCYRDECMASFKTFLCLVAKRRIWNAIRQFTARTKIGGFDVVELDAMVNDDESFYDIIEQRNPMFDPEYCCRYHDMEDLLLKCLEKLTKKEADVLCSWYEGDRYDEAARKHCCSRKAYDGRLQRVRTKIKDVIRYR